MSLLIDLFGYLSVVVHGLVILAQAVALGSTFFLVALVRPLAPALGAEARPIFAAVGRIAAWGAAALVMAEGAYLAMQAAVIGTTVGLPLDEIAGASFAVAGLVKCVAAVALCLAIRVGGRGAPSLVLLALCVIVLAAAAATTHAAARLDDRALLLMLETLHQFGAALWIGGIPVFLSALARIQGGPAWRLVGKRFSRLSTVGVVSILASGLGMSVFYVGDVHALYGTAFGVMVGAKVAMFGMLLALGFGNFLLVERLRTAPATPTGRLRRFAEAEIGIGFTIFFAAASLTSVPPAVDLTNDRVGWPEIAERYTPALPRLASPDHDALGLSRLQAELDADAAADRTRETSAFVPGSGELPPRNTADIAWSEYNHHWAGLFVLAISLLAMLAKAGLRLCRNWPLLFVAFGVFLVLRADPEIWPLGGEGLIESLRDVETLQHRAFELLIFAFAFVEWRVQRLDLRGGWMPLVFPLIAALGGALLLTHQHAISNVKDQLLIELSHTPLALLAVAAGWSRWLDIRLDRRHEPTIARVAAWCWTVCLVGIGVVLLLYREA